MSTAQIQSHSEDKQKNPVEFVKFYSMNSGRAVTFCAAVPGIELTHCGDPVGSRFSSLKNGVLLHFPIANIDAALAQVNADAQFSDSEGNILGLYAKNEHNTRHYRL